MFSSLEISILNFLRNGELHLFDGPTTAYTEHDVRTAARKLMRKGIIKQVALTAKRHTLKRLKLTDLGDMYPL